MATNALPVLVGVLAGLLLGAACMAMWAAARIGEEAARQFDRGFERGRWLADLATNRALPPPPRSQWIHPATPVAEEPPSRLLLP